MSFTDGGGVASFESGTDYTEIDAADTSKEQNETEKYSAGGTGGDTERILGEILEELRRKSDGEEGSTSGEGTGEGETAAAGGNNEQPEEQGADTSGTETETTRETFYTIDDVIAELENTNLYLEEIRENMITMGRNQILLDRVTAAGIFMLLGAIIAYIFLGRIR